MKMKKKCHYNDRRLNVDNRYMVLQHLFQFPPLVFSINGGMSRENMLYHKQLAEKLQLTRINDTTK